MNINYPLGHSVSLEKRKISGAHYTPVALADFVASKIIEYFNTTEDSINILDPAVGDGQLLFSLIQQLKSSRTINIFGYDTDKNALDFTQSRLNSQFPNKYNLVTNLYCQDFLNYIVENRSIGFFEGKLPQADIIIANPPYVRTQVLGSERAQILASQFNLEGRVDLYHAFLKALELVIKPDGIIGIIVSNRVLSIKSTNSLRESLSNSFNILHIWDLGDTKLFKAAVLPAILLLQKKNVSKGKKTIPFSRIYSTKTKENATIFNDNILQEITNNGIIQTNKGQKYLIENGILDLNSSKSNVWTITTKDSDKWSNTVNQFTVLHFEDVCKIKVGVKTTNDKVFIRSDWDLIFPEEKPELLRTIQTHVNASQYRTLVSCDSQILYTHEKVNGKRKAVRIEDYPISYNYLLQYKKELENREYIKKAGRKWFEVWVPHDPELWANDKIVFKDISEKPTFWLDRSGSVINGDCYWILLNQEVDYKLLWLILAISNSSFIEAYYDRHFNNKLYSGKRRYISQYVEKFPLPDPENKMAEEIIQICQQLYVELPSANVDKMIKELNKLVWAVFGLTCPNNF